MNSDCCNMPLYWELWFCNKNPEGLRNEPREHGNIIDGTITCSDDYCHPDTATEQQITAEQYNKHEYHGRCSKCHNLNGD
jgi:hypothetical protein